MKTYKIENPTTQQMIEAIENQEYFTMEQFNQKKKQLSVYFNSLWPTEPLISFTNMTNTGGYPIVFPSGEMHEALQQFNNEIPSDEQIELFACYAQQF